MLNHDKIICVMRVIRSVVIREKPASKGPRIRSRHGVIITIKSVCVVKIDSDL